MRPNSIPLSSILTFDEIANVKIRFNKHDGKSWNPLELFKNGDTERLLKGQYWNNAKRKSFKRGQITVGFARLEKDLWLLFHVGRVTKDLNKYGGIGFEYASLSQFDKYCGRLIVRYRNKVRTMIRNAAAVIDECEVVQILPDVFDDDDIFPGYDRVKITWSELKRVIGREGWKAALSNQKGIYLVTDASNGQMYVGSASGSEMLLGRWKSYVKTGHGGNAKLKKLGFEHIKRHFRYSILEIFKSTTEKQLILNREEWWKDVLHTKGRFGYNH